MPLSVADTLDFVSFFAFKCNGTSIVAEMHREIMSDLVGYLGLYYDSSSMYDFLCKVNEIVSDKDIGSSTEPRFTFCGGSSNIDWASLQNELLGLINTFRKNFNSSPTRATLKKETSKMIKALLTSKNDKNEKIFKGSGAMSANHFVHMSALLGLIPLGAYLFAEIRSSDLGPGKILNEVYGGKRKLTTEECTERLYHIHKKFAKVWNDMPTVNFIENALCYCYRTYANTVRSLPKDKKYPITIITNDDVRKESRTKNVYFMDIQRDHVQNFFLVRTSGSSATNVKPVLMMKDASKWHLGDTANVRLTNWDSNGKKSLLGWNVNDTNLFLNTLLDCDDQLESIYKL